MSRFRTTFGTQEDKRSGSLPELCAAARYMSPWDIGGRGPRASAGKSLNGRSRSSGRMRPLTPTPIPIAGALAMPCNGLSI
jgi:hypothetical protein